MIKLTPESIAILQAWANDLLTTYPLEDFEEDDVKFIEEILSYEPE